MLKINKIGLHVHIASHCNLAGSAGIIMEDFFGLSAGINIFTGTDDYMGMKLTNPTIPKKIYWQKIRKSCFKKHVIIGTGSVILPDCVMGEGSSVGGAYLW